MRQRMESLRPMLQLVPTQNCKKVPSDMSDLLPACEMTVTVRLWDADCACWMLLLEWMHAWPHPSLQVPTIAAGQFWHCACLLLYCCDTAASMRRFSQCWQAICRAAPLNPVSHACAMKCLSSKAAQAAF